MDLKESVFKFCAVPDFEFLVSLELPLLFLEHLPFLFLFSEEPCCWGDGLVDLVLHRFGISLMCWLIDDRECFEVSRAHWFLSLKNKWFILG